MPSATLSMVSHCRIISLWINPLQVVKGMKFGEPGPPVLANMDARQDVRLLKFTAGAPITMPSKSVGNISAAFMPCLGIILIILESWFHWVKLTYRPPPEHPI